MQQLQLGIISLKDLKTILLKLLTSGRKRPLSSIVCEGIGSNFDNFHLTDRAKLINIYPDECFVIFQFPNSTEPLFGPSLFPHSPFEKPSHLCTN